MPVLPQRQRHYAAAAVASLAVLAGCSSVDGATHSIANAITPYKVEVVQGNFVSREQVESLQKGMTREQVRAVLGTPLVSSLFHADRWDYVFTLKRRGLESQRRELTVYFKDELLDRVEGDTMPSESEFVTTITRRKLGKVPRLEATEEELRAFQARNKPAAPVAAESSAATGPVPSNYPPLESAPR